MQTTVQKLDGTRESFNREKLATSLKKAGSSQEHIREIVAHIESELYEGIPTSEIYRHAFELLREYPEPVAARYSLRRALFSLGPTGFPFEDFIAKLYEHDGYTVKTRIELKGKCALHEVDVLAWRDAESVIIEAKFHQQPGTKSDLQVALYSYARFLDLKGTRIEEAEKNVTHIAAATNTKFTSAALDYGKCMGIELIDWSHPQGASLHERIERAKLYPVTVLSTLDTREKAALLEQKTVLCKDIIDNRSLLQSVGIKGVKIQSVLEEGARLCRIQ